MNDTKEKDTENGSTKEVDTKEVDTKEVDISVIKLFLLQNGCDFLSYENDVIKFTCENKHKCCNLKDNIVRLAKLKVRNHPCGRCQEIKDFTELNKLGKLFGKYPTSMPVPKTQEDTQNHINFMYGMNNLFRYYGAQSDYEVTTTVREPCIIM